MKDTLSTSRVARMLGVAVGSVSNWIDREQLKAGRTPGGHRRVAVKDLVAFLRKQKLPVPPELEVPPARVLVVDDDAGVASWIADEVRLAHPDYEVLTALDGFAAGEIVGSRRPDLVILDVRMPGIDGFEVCRRIKSRPETQDITVIAVTAYPAESVSERARECGARACLTKPLEISALLREIEAVL